MLTRLALLVHRRAAAVAGLAVLVGVVALLSGSGVAEHLDPYGDDDPASESVRARTLIEQAEGAQSEPGLLVVVRASSRSFTTSRRARGRLARIAASLRRDRDVARVTTAFDTGGPAFLSDDRRSALLTVHLRPLDDGGRQRAADRLAKGLAGRPGVSVGGSAAVDRDFNTQIERDLRRAEILVMPIVFLLALAFFRGLVAAALPPLIGGLSIVLTLAMLRQLAEAMSLSVFALNLVTGLGLGLAIDYSLFVVSRFREELARSGDVADALVATMRTAGRTVLFSALTVAAALAALLVFPQRFLYSMGVGGALVALLAAGIALTVLPAILALLGPRVNALAPRALRRAAERDARADEQGRWYRLALRVMRRPALVAGATAVVLAACALPALRANFAEAGAEALPRDAQARIVAREVDRRFPQISTNQLTVYVRTARAGTTERLGRRIARVDGVRAVAPARELGRGAGVLEVNVAGGARSPATLRTVERIRALPSGGGVEMLVTGAGAEYADLRASLKHHLPIALLVLAGTTMVLLFLLTGSVVLPLKSLAMNVLSLGATFGLLVLIFQDGRLEGVLGFTSSGSLEISQPILLCAVAFGLSTDYGVFLLARIKEARERGLEDRAAIASGLERTGRIVTAAALLFAVAIGAFATSEIALIKEVGIGTALAVLIDATIVRAFLVPSLMALLGRANWWAPRWLVGVRRRVGLADPPPLVPGPGTLG